MRTLRRIIEREVMEEVVERDVCKELGGFCKGFFVEC